MSIVQFSALLALLVVTSIGPGLVVVRRLRWSPLETVCAAVALSHLLLYVAGMAIYVFDARSETSYVVSLAAVAATAVCWRDLHRLWTRRQVRHAVLAVAGLFGWVMVIQLIVRNYSGGTSFGDWYEHYERARFFLDRPDVYTKFLEIPGSSYALPARPPLMNVLASFYMAQVGGGFEVFQVVFTWLNVLPVLAAIVLLPMLLPGARRPIWLLVALCALNPFFIQNAALTWTKLYCAFLVVLAIALYRRGWDRPGHARLIGAFTALAAAMITHYSAGPFLVFMAAHYLLVLIWRRAARWRELAGIVAAGTVVLATWFAWSIHTYGVGFTLSQNTTVGGYTGAPAARPVADAAYNLYATVVPYPLRGDPVQQPEFLTNRVAVLRDAFFNLYQSNLLLVFGLVGWLAVLYLLARAVGFDRRVRRRDRNFWLGLLLFCVPVGILTHAQTAYYGVAHVTAQPVIVLGLALLAAGFARLPRLLRWGCVLGLAVDALLGVLLHVHLQSITFPAFVDERGMFRIGVDAGMGRLTFDNFHLKTVNRVRFLADHVVAWRTALEALLAFGTVTLIAFVAKRKPAV